MQIIENMMTTTSAIKDSFIHYSNQYYNLTIFMVLAFALYVFGKEKTDKYIAYYIFAVFVLGLCPFSYNNILLFGMPNSTYQNVFWLIPGIALIAYSIVKILQERNKSLIVGAIGCYLLVAFVCADFSIVNPNFEINQYRVSDDIHEINMILEENSVNKIATTTDVSTALIEVGVETPFMYGVSDVSGDFVSQKDLNSIDFYQKVSQMEVEPWNLSAQLGYAREYGCDCVIINRAYDNENFMYQNGAEVMGRTENYVIYRIL